ncbi:MULTISPECIES: hypothetical protein [Micromonospora]|uniref:Uncharacterized protein n=1 Tax=Micromonospora yangpuensis TaxID=683228 RepID=A0A1C6V0H7_9ACTN|nr:hypothetical protein [Micromonospora yangpuensis]GGL96963.1 hypothetical protein GCM10012279_13020 [Micromonospora yangpuensis]SCL59802.1 hypothetical protein GA0070617_4201 [Micromonospora yangpuensis]
MAEAEPGSAREEAERLVATLLAAARLASSGSRAAQAWGPLGGMLSGVLGHSGGPGGSSRTRPAAPAGGFATGTPECCVCPLCRAIVAMRDPSPEFAERLATGAGDLAAGVASMMRAFASADDRPPSSASPVATGGAGAAGPSAAATGTDANADHVWREATRTGHDSASAPEQDVWSAATRSGDAAARAAAVPPAEVVGPGAPVTPRPPADGPAVPASRAPEAGEHAPGDGA